MRSCAALSCVGGECTPLSFTAASVRRGFHCLFVSSAQLLAAIAERVNFDNGIVVVEGVVG